MGQRRGQAPGSPANCPHHSQQRNGKQAKNQRFWSVYRANKGKREELWSLWSAQALRWHRHDQKRWNLEAEGN